MNTILDLLRYFFHPIPGSTFNYYIPLLVLAVLLTIGGIALKLYIKKAGSDNRAFKKLFQNIPYQILWIVVFLLLNLFGRYERFPLLGARFVLYITVLAALYVIGKSIYRYVKVYPTEKLKFKETPAQKKYRIEKHSRR